MIGFTGDPDLGKRAWPKDKDQRNEYFIKELLVSPWDPDWAGMQQGQKDAGKVIAMFLR